MVKPACFFRSSQVLKTAKELPNPSALGVGHKIKETETYTGAENLSLCPVAKDRQASAPFPEPACASADCPVREQSGAVF